MKLHTFTVWGARGVARAELTAPQHLVVPVDSWLRARVLRDAACAVLYGPGLFPGGRRGGLRRAELTFEVNGLRYRCAVDLVEGGRFLTIDGNRQPIADGAGAVTQMLGPLLHLPGAVIYRSLVMFDHAPATGALPHAALPGVPLALREPLLRYLEAPDEVEARLAELDRRVGELDTQVAELSHGGGAFDVVFRKAARRREEELEALSARLQVARAEAARRREEVDGLRRLLAGFEAAGGDHRAAARLAASPRADEEILDHVEVFAGDPPRRELVEQMARPFELAGSAGLNAAWILAAAAARGRTPPLFWLGDGPLSLDQIDWPALHRAMGDLPLLVFAECDAPTGSRPARMERVD